MKLDGIFLMVITHFTRLPMEESTGLFISSFTPRYATTILFFDESNGFAGGYSNLLKTSDGGLTWSEVNNYIFSLFNLLFYHQNIGFISVPNGIRKTTNGGVDMEIYRITSL